MLRFIFALIIMPHDTSKYPYPHVFTGLVNLERVGHGHKFHSAGTVHFNLTVQFHCTGVVWINQHMVLRRFTCTVFTQAAPIYKQPISPQYRLKFINSL